MLLLHVDDAPIVRFSAYDTGSTTLEVIGKLGSCTAATAIRVRWGWVIWALPPGQLLRACWVCKHKAQLRFSSPDVHPFSSPRVWLGSFFVLHFVLTSICVHLCSRDNGMLCYCECGVHGHGVILAVQSLPSVIWLLSTVGTVHMWCVECGVWSMVLALVSVLLFAMCYDLRLSSSCVSSHVCGVNHLSSEWNSR